MIEERDRVIPMQDGTRITLGVYRPDAPGKYPVLYACALHNKDIQGPDIADVLPAHAGVKPQLIARPAPVNGLLTIQYDFGLAPSHA